VGQTEKRRKKTKRSLLICLKGASGVRWGETRNPEDKEACGAVVGGVLLEGQLVGPWRKRGVLLPLMASIRRVRQGRKRSIFAPAHADRNPLDPDNDAK